MSGPPAAPLLLASTSPQRRAILTQLAVPFDAVAPSYEEHDPPGADPVELVRAHARGKARSVAGLAGDRPVLGVDTTVVLDGESYGKAADAGEAERMLERFSGRTHAVVSGLCLLTRAWEEAKIIQYAYAYEQATHYRQPPPTVPALAAPVTNRPNCSPRLFDTGTCPSRVGRVAAGGSSSRSNPV